MESVLTWQFRKRTNNCSLKQRRRTARFEGNILLESLPAPPISSSQSTTESVYSIGTNTLFLTVFAPGSKLSTLEVAAGRIPRSLIVLTFRAR